MLPQRYADLGVNVAADPLDAAAARETADVAFCYAFDCVAEDLPNKDISVDLGTV